MSDDKIVLVWKEVFSPSKSNGRVQHFAIFDSFDSMLKALGIAHIYRDVMLSDDIKLKEHLLSFFRINPVYIDSFETFIKKVAIPDPINFEERLYFEISSESSGQHFKEGVIFENRSNLDAYFKTKYPARFNWPARPIDEVSLDKVKEEYYWLYAMAETARKLNRESRDYKPSLFTHYAYINYLTCQLSDEVRDNL